MHRSFRYRLWTNTNLERELGVMLESHRRLYNAALEQRKTAWETEQRSVSYNEQAAWFTQERKTNPFYARLNAASGQQTLRRLDRAYQAFFRRIKAGETPGYPRFKARDRFDSFTFQYATSGRVNGTKLIGNRLRVQHVGTIRVKFHRPVEGVIKTVTLKREAGKWYVIFACELPDVPLVDTGKPPIGIDVGLTHFLTTSDDKTETNPRYLKDALPDLRRAQRSLCRKKKGGSNRRKQQRKVAKIHARVRNLRREHHFQVACRLVLAYGLFAVERLNVRGMLGNHRLARAISDAGWSGFLSVLRGQAEKAGAQFVEVDPRGTSQECSGCGQEVRKDLSVRRHDCPHCGLSLDRDHNAALNILARARLARTGPAGPQALSSAVPRSRRKAE